MTPSRESKISGPRMKDGKEVVQPSPEEELRDESTYRQGYSSYTLANHQRRTAEADAAFLLPHIKKNGPHSRCFAKYATEGMVVGLDISAEVLENAKALAADARVPTAGPGSVAFEQGNVLERLPHPDDTFDIVYCSQVLGHIPSSDLVIQALIEMRRVLNPGGILASREAAAQHFWPKSLDLDRLWVQNPQGPCARDMPALVRIAGFDVGRGKVRVGAGTSLCAGLEARKWIAWRAAGQLKPGDPFRQSWLDAGITEDEI
ncbi:S-adenosyl-L-methionine-dependent methyltransferase [Achaetomium macrosporum]|uniref:S-adenosyl-L-methionine-dependent methyltransferase n=1 Tax=Achaetomium macrosporum TaxID=79813 RepID=A0AAN7H6I4_9PEZI|nr:S-adenosyl-L-methionine-dependent methyltransferase [Achaetomium macrosporum]